MLIPGPKLTVAQRREVLARFIYRHLDTTSKTDDEWLAKHAFHFIADGSRLSNRHRYAEPYYGGK